VTDRQTDGRTDRIAMAKMRYSSSCCCAYKYKSWVSLFSEGTSAWCQYTSQWQWKENGFWNLFNSTSGDKGWFQI